MKLGGVVCEKLETLRGIQYLPDVTVLFAANEYGLAMEYLSEANVTSSHPDSEIRELILKIEDLMSQVSRLYEA